MPLNLKNKLKKLQTEEDFYLRALKKLFGYWHPKEFFDTNKKNIIIASEEEYINKAIKAINTNIPNAKTRKSALESLKELPSFKSRPNLHILVRDMFIVSTLFEDNYTGLSYLNSLIAGSKEIPLIKRDLTNYVEKTESLILQDRPTYRAYIPANWKERRGAPWIKRAVITFAYFERVYPILDEVNKTKNYSLLYTGHTKVWYGRYFECKGSRGELRKIIERGIDTYCYDPSKLEYVRLLRARLPLKPVSRGIGVA